MIKDTCCPMQSPPKTPDERPGTHADLSNRITLPTLVARSLAIREKRADGNAPFLSEAGCTAGENSQSLVKV